jgi:hypothetical protein
MMNNFAVQLYRIIVPKFLRRKIQARVLPLAIFEYYANFPEEARDPEIAPILDYLKTNPISMLPYPFLDRYRAQDISVYDDPEKGLRYVLFEGEKKLYFKRRWGKKKIQKAYNDLLKEQDPRSPHRYLNGQFQFDKGDILIDAGAAEGIFALSVIEKASRVILIEAGKEWIEPLKATFAPWKDKVEIIHRFASDRSGAKYITLDEVISPEEKGIFLKADVEGAELSLLKGSERLLSKQEKLKIAICTYHNEKDEEEITAYLLQYPFDLSPSEGYILPVFDKKLKAPFFIKPPFFRRGLLRAVKQKN